MSKGCSDSPATVKAGRSPWTVRVSASVARRIAPDGPARAVARMFGLRAGKEVLYEKFTFPVAAGEVVAVIGPSGAGKTTLMEAAARSVPGAIGLSVARLARSATPAVACLPARRPTCGKQAGLKGPGGGGSVTDEGLRDRLRVLSYCGLAEAAALVTPARCLSGGQLYRLALAAAVWRAVRSGRARLVLADEFAASLDRTTAEVLAGQVRKLISRAADAFGQPLGMIVSTPREDLLGALAPDRVVVKPLGEPARLIEGAGKAGGARARPAMASAPGGASAVTGWRIVRGTMDDYRALGRFHYRARRPAAIKRIWAVRVPPKRRRAGDPHTAAVLIVSPPVLNCRGRNVATGGRYLRPNRRAGTRRLNAEMECVSRVIVHPIFRGCGLAVRLVRHALRTAPTGWVEALAAMGAVHPFFERAGMTAYGRFGRGGGYHYYLGAPAAKKSGGAPLAGRAVARRQAGRQGAGDMKGR